MKLIKENIEPLKNKVWYWNKIRTKIDKQITKEIKSLVENKTCDEIWNNQGMCELENQIHEQIWRSIGAEIWWEDDSDDKMSIAYDPD